MKFKKLISMLLAVLMMFSCLNVGFYAFADGGSKAECDAEVKNFVSTPVNRADIGGDIIWTVEGVQNTLDSIWDLIAYVVNSSDIVVNGKTLKFKNGLNEVAVDLIYQPDMVSSVFGAYANLSHNEDPSDATIADVYPTNGDLFYALFNSKVIADYLEQSDGKFNGAIQKIRAIEVTEVDKANGLNDLDILAGIEFTAEDFGFKGGNKDGFINSLLAVLRPFTSLMVGDSSKPVSFNMFDTEEKQGVYSIIIPLLENIGLINMPTSAEYKENYLAVQAESGNNVCLDEVLRPIIDSAFENVIQPIIDKPFDGIVDILPRFAYVLESGILNDNVAAANKAIDGSNAEETVEITPEYVNCILKGIEIPVDEAGNNTIRLKAINWRLFADCVTVKTVKSSSDDYDCFVLRTGETDSTVANIFYYIHEVFFADKQNYKALRSMVEADFADDKTTLAIMLGIIDDMASSGRNPAFGKFLDTFGEKGRTPIKREKAAAQKRFNDVSGFELYDDYLAYTSVYNSFITGTNPPERTVFSPNDAITRAMFITILYRMAGEPYKNANPYDSTPFTDITNTSVYYYDAACWALDMGITTQTTFRPNSNVSREETVVFLYRYAYENGLIYEYDNYYMDVDLSIFADYESIHNWAVEAMQWASFNGIVTGTQQGTANPQGATKRIHASKILYGFGKSCDIGNFK